MASLYVLAFTSCGVDPGSIPISGADSPNDLLSFLSRELDEEMKRIVLDGYPVTTYYQVGLAFLALCESRSLHLERHVDNFAAAVMKRSFSIDTGAMLAMAFRCLEDRDYKPQSVRSPLIRLTTELYCTRGVWGGSERAYSAGLAMQALFGNREYMPVDVWEYERILPIILGEINDGIFDIPIAAAQLLPAILEKSYLDLMHFNYTVTVGLNEEERCGQEGTIPVVYTVTQSVHYSHTIYLKVAEGETILEVMDAAQKCESRYFKYETIHTVWGPMVTVIGGTNADPSDHTYWEFLIGTKPINVGVASYEVKPDDHIFAIFTTY